jgi:protein involved in polysaccharide export with SLBB domain
MLDSRHASAIEAVTVPSTPLRRCLAALLVAQPVLWTSDIARAQTFQPPLSSPGELPNALRRPTGEVGPGAEGGAAQLAAPPSFPQQLDADLSVLDRANVPPTATPIDVPIDPDRYLCGPGDVLELNFWGVQNFKQRVVIDVEGRAFVPRVGSFDLKGKTLTEARRALRESVARYYRLSFDVTLAEPRTFLVQVVDDVVRPGSYPARAVDRVATLVSRAGGFGPNASRRRVEIRRRDGSVRTADLLLYALSGDLEHNPYLLDGDVVRVPFEELAASITGAVNRPGHYELVTTRDLAELVEVAGGLSPKATRLLPITVVRRGEADREDLQQFQLGDGKLPAVAIHREDRVRIPEVEELQQSVVVVGAFAGAVPVGTAPARSSESGAPGERSTAPEEVSATRRLPFVKGDTVRTLLERVRGVGPLADLAGAYIARNGQPIPVDLYKLVMLRDLSADRPIELGDTLVIPFKRRNVVVEGAVLAPGSYPYNPAFGVEQYLSLAGGASRNSQGVESVTIVSPNGETTRYHPGIKVDPGSSLVVPERTFSRPEVVSIILSAAGIILSGVAVAIAASK